MIEIFQINGETAMVAPSSATEIEAMHPSGEALGFCSRAVRAVQVTIHPKSEKNPILHQENVSVLGGSAYQ